MQRRLSGEDDTSTFYSDAGYELHADPTVTTASRATAETLSTCTIPTARRRVTVRPRHRSRRAGGANGLGPLTLELGGYANRRLNQFSGAAEVDFAQFEEVRLDAFGGVTSATVMESSSSSARTARAERSLTADHRPSGPAPKSTPQSVR